jgi:hypothetical protein
LLKYAETTARDGTKAIPLPKPMPSP